MSVRELERLMHILLVYVEMNGKKKETNFGKPELKEWNIAGRQLSQHVKWMKVII